MKKLFPEKTTSIFNTSHRGLISSPAGYKSMVNQHYLIDKSSISSTRLNALNSFWFGFVLYSSSYVFSRTGYFNFVICQLLQTIGIGLFFPTAIYLIKLKIKNNYLAYVFILYIFWSLTIVLRGIRFDYNSLKLLFLNADYGLFLYFAPAIVLFPKDLIYYKKAFEAILIFGLIFILYDVLFIRELLDRSRFTQSIIEDSVKGLSLPCGFILLTYKYHSNKRKYLALGVMIISLFFSIYKARRGLSFICLSVLTFSYLQYLFTTRQKLFIIYTSLLFIVLGSVYANSLYKIKNDGIFSQMYERGDEDTRTGVEIYFYDDMKTKDWIIGRGINGEYFCPIDEFQLTDYRDIIETGYLQIILKGGIISLALYLLITIPAIFLGLFYSKNILSKASAIWIFISLISLYPATVNTFNMNFLLVWISVGICYSKQIRSIADNTIKQYLDTSTVKIRT